MRWIHARRLSYTSWALLMMMTLNVLVSNHSQMQSKHYSSKHSKHMKNSFSQLKFGLWCFIATIVLYWSCSSPRGSVDTEWVAVNKRSLNCTDTENVRCVFEVQGRGGLGRIANQTLSQILQEDGVFNVLQDLQSFSGLTTEELLKRLRREGQFHFEGEHAWWGPTSHSELVWYYRGSVSYLFGNAIHPAPARQLELSQADGPILDYSGGVGNNVLFLASKGIECSYFGIGEMEAAFARFRVKGRNLTHLVRFLEPYAFNGDNVYRFDPIKSVPNQSFGAILLYDVLEHIPNYHYTLAHLVTTLRVGGRIFEQSPFAQKETDNGVTDIHLEASIPLDKAMAICGMQREGAWWRKVKEPLIPPGWLL